MEATTLDLAPASEGVRNWSNQGAKFTKTARQRANVVGAIKRLEWVKPEGEFPMLPAENIKAAIRCLRIPKVSLIAIGTMGRYGFYGIEGNYANGRARFYILDRGSEVVPLASDFFAKAEAPAAPAPSTPAAG